MVPPHLHSPLASKQSLSPQVCGHSAIPHPGSWVEDDGDTDTVTEVVFPAVMLTEDAPALMLTVPRSQYASAGIAPAANMTSAANAAMILFACFFIYFLRCR